MARRRKSKESAGAEAVGIIIVLAVAFFMLNGSSSNPVAAAALSALKTPLLLLLGFVAVMGVIRFLAAQNSSKSKPQNKQRYQKAPRPTKPQAKNTSIRTNDVSKIARPTAWSEALIDQLEWRVFEKLCTRLWEEKGFSAKETNAGADGGVDFYLYANSTKQKIGAVQCKSWGKKRIGVKVLRELQGVVASAKYERHPFP